MAYCTIETDRINEYPKGAGCVVFQDEMSYRRAIATHQLNVKFDDGVRKVGGSTSFPLANIHSHCSGRDEAVHCQRYSMRSMPEPQHEVLQVGAFCCLICMGYHSDLSPCSSQLCLAYYCDCCWPLMHNSASKMDHMPMKRGRGGGAGDS